MPIENGVTIKVLLPENLQSRLAHDAEAVGVPVASMVRMIIAQHYELLANQGGLGDGDDKPIMPTSPA